MKIFVYLLSFIFSVTVFSCRQRQKTITNLELGFRNDTTAKAECFADFFRSKIKSIHPDTLMSRFAFPFTYVFPIGEKEFVTRKFHSTAEIKANEKYKELLQQVHGSFQPETRFEQIFATNGLPERRLKLSFHKGNDRFVLCFFITQNGLWFLKSFQEVPAFEDGGLPIEEPDF